MQVSVVDTTAQTMATTMFAPLRPNFVVQGAFHQFTDPRIQMGCGMAILGCDRSANACRGLGRRTIEYDRKTVAIEGVG